MMEARNFIAALSKAGKSRKDIKPLVNATYGDNPLLISQINQIIKAVQEGKLASDKRHPNTKKKQSRLTTLWLLSPPPLRKTGA
jgi:hypothetical protein